MANRPAAVTVTPQPETKGVGMFAWVTPRKGGLEGFETSVGSFNDSGRFLFDSAEMKTTKSGVNKGKSYFVCKAVDGGKNGCFKMEEVVALELETENLNLVDGTIETRDGVKGIANASLILGRGIRGQKVGGALQLVTD